MKIKIVFEFILTLISCPYGIPVLTIYNVTLDSRV